MRVYPFCVCAGMLQICPTAAPPHMEAGIRLTVFLFRAGMLQMCPRTPPSGGGWDEADIISFLCWNVPNISHSCPPRGEGWDEANIMYFCARMFQIYPTTAPPTWGQPSIHTSIIQTCRLLHIVNRYRERLSAIPLINGFGK